MSDKKPGYPEMPTEKKPENLSKVASGLVGLEETYSTLVAMLSTVDENIKEKNSLVIDLESQLRTAAADLEAMAKSSNSLRDAARLAADTLDGVRLSLGKDRITREFF